MAASHPNRSLVARASAVLTTGEVAATRLDLNETFDFGVSVQVDFTIGMLTNVILKFYVSADGVTYRLISAPVAVPTLMAATLTAASTAVIPVPNLSGWKFFRATAQGTGTVTDSLLTLTYRYARRGSQ